MTAQTGHLLTTPAVLDRMARDFADHDALVTADRTFTFAELREEGLPVMATMLSSSVKIKESHQLSTPMIHLDPGHKLSQEYAALFDELEASRQVADRRPVRRRA